VRTAEAELRARKTQVSLTASERLPDLVVEGHRNKLGTNGDSAMRLVFALPLLDFGRIGNEVKSARADVREQEALLTQVKHQVLLQVATAFAHVQQARDLVVRYERDIVPRTERLTETIQKGFNAGASTHLDVLDAQRTLRSVQTEYRQSIADYAKALAELERATGTTQ
jgi:cobalt-zinc-cadmium efflux system outer membrane protein